MTGRWSGALESLGLIKISAGFLPGPNWAARRRAKLVRAEIDKGCWTGAITGLGLGGRVPELATFVQGFRIVDTMFGLRRIVRGGGTTEGFEDAAEVESRSSDTMPFARCWSTRGFCFCCLCELVDRSWSGGGTVSRLLIGKAMTTGDEAG